MAGRAFAARAAAFLILTAPAARADEPLVRTVAEAQVSWAAGTVTAQGGAAADPRLPSLEMARPGAERRARGAALAKLRAALQELPVRRGRKLPAGVIDHALSRAFVARADYQSNGGVLLALGVRFGDLTEGKGSDVKRDAAGDHEDDSAATLAVSSMPFELAPTVAAGSREAAVGFAVYRLGAPAKEARALAVKRDRAGRLILGAGAGDVLEKLAGRRVVIYVQKITSP